MYWEIPGKSWVFQHDNDTKHITVKTREWLKTNKISDLERSIQAPDIKPIGNIWKHIKMIVHQWNTENTSEIVWWFNRSVNGVNYIGKFVSSHSKWLMELIANNGYNIRWNTVHGCVSNFTLYTCVKIPNTFDD